MTTFVEQVVDEAPWPANTQQGLSAPPDTIPGENLSLWDDDSPRISRKALLTRIVEAEILPRLARARRNPPPDAADITPLTTEDDTAELVRVLLTQDAAGAVAFIDMLRLRGATLASLYLGIVTQAAICLGELWDQDRCDFAQVTISMGRLQQVLRTLSPLFQQDAVRRAQTDTVLLVAAPGEQHTFGLVMLGEFFAREGWNVVGGPGTSASQAADIVRGTWIDVAGFSIGSNGRLEALAQCIRTVRRASRNPNLGVMVGGPLLLSQPDLVTRVGADTAAIDAAAAVRQARGLLTMRMAAD